MRGCIINCTHPGGGEKDISVPHLIMTVSGPLPNCALQQDLGNHTLDGEVSLVLKMILRCSTCASVLILLQLVRQKVV